MNNQTVLFVGPGEVVFDECPQPILKPKQLLIQAECTLISTGTELTCLHRNFAEGSHFDEWVKYPFQPGYSSAGTVIEVGPAVTRFRPGDRIASRSPHQRFCAVDEDAAVHIPAEVSSDDAAWFGIACIVQNGVRRAHHELGDTVAIVGLGLLGQMAVQYARLSGARNIIGIETSPLRLKLAIAHGATHTFCKSAAAARTEIGELTHGRLCEVVYDITGHPAALAQSLALARTLGKVVLLGDVGAPLQQPISGDLITRGLTLVGAHDNNPPQYASAHAYWTRQNMAELYMHYLARGQMQIGSLNTHRYPAHDAMSAYRFLTQNRADAMGVLLVWN